MDALINGRPLTYFSSSSTDNPGRIPPSIPASAPLLLQYLPALPGTHLRNSPALSILLLPLRLSDHLPYLPHYELPPHTRDQRLPQSVLSLIFTHIPRSHHPAAHPGARTGHHRLHLSQGAGLLQAADCAMDQSGVEHGAVDRNGGDRVVGVSEGCRAELRGCRVGRWIGSGLVRGGEGAGW